MVALSAILAHITGIPHTFDGPYLVCAEPDGEPYIARWDVAKLGPQPTGEQIAAAGFVLEKAEACARIEAECATRRAAGVLVQFPDGPGIVQTRSEIDLINVTGVSSAGLAATVSGDTPELYFRDAANVNHALLPTQAVHFGAQVMQRLQAITKAAHDAKDAINTDGVTTLEQIASIEAAVAWPA